MVAVRQAEVTDVEHLLSIAEDMDRFYGATELEPIEVRWQQIHQALFSDDSSAHALLAFDHGDPVGFASYSFLWPAAGLTQSLYLKELFVPAKARRQGVGRALMERLIDIAKKAGCTRVEWTTDADNHDAQRFYERLGHEQNQSKLIYRVELLEA